METRKTTNADHKPNPIENLGDGTYHYNFDVVQEETEKGNSESWSYNQVRLPYPIDIERIQNKININKFNHTVNESEVIRSVEY